jgi:hypothetical protein
MQNVNFYARKSVILVCFTAYLSNVVYKNVSWV